MDGARSLGAEDNCRLNGLFRRERPRHVRWREAFELGDEAVDREEGDVERAESTVDRVPLAVPDRVAAVDDPLTVALDDPGDLVVAPLVLRRHRGYLERADAPCLP